MRLMLFLRYTWFVFRVLARYILVFLGAFSLVLFVLPSLLYTQNFSRCRASVGFELYSYRAPCTIGKVAWQVCSQPYTVNVPGCMVCGQGIGVRILRWSSHRY